MAKRPPGKTSSAKKPASGKEAVPTPLAFLSGLDELSVPELNAVLEKAEALKASKLETARSDFIARMKAEGGELGVDLGTAFLPPAKRGKRPRGTPRKPRSLTPKYRSPDGLEWTGLGKAPKWLKDAEAEGKNREEFLIR